MRSHTLVPRDAWQAPALVCVSALARALWRSLWHEVGDSGGYPDHPIFLRRAVALEVLDTPTDEALTQAVAELEDHGLVRRYEVRGVRYIWHIAYAEANLQLWRGLGPETYPHPPWVGIETDAPRGRMRFVLRGEEEAPDSERDSEPVRLPVGQSVQVPVPEPVPEPVADPVLARARASSSGLFMGDTPSALADARAKGQAPAAEEDEAEALSRPPSSAAAYLHAVEQAIGRRVYPAGASALVRAGITPAMAAELARLAEKRAPGRWRNLAYLVAIAPEDPTPRARDRPTALRDILPLGGIVRA